MYIFHVTTCMHAHIKQIKFSRFSEVYYLITGNLQCIWWDYWSFEIDFLVYIFHWSEKDTGTYNYLADCFYLPILNYWCFELIRFEFFWNFIQIIFKCSWKYERNTCTCNIYIYVVSSINSGTFIFIIKYCYWAIMSFGTCSYRNW